MSMYDKYDGPINSNDAFEREHVEPECPWCGGWPVQRCQICGTLSCNEHRTICTACKRRACPDCMSDTPNLCIYCSGKPFNEGMYDKYDGPIKSNDNFGGKCSFCNRVAQDECSDCDNIICSKHVKDCGKCGLALCLTCGDICKNCLATIGHRCDFCDKPADGACIVCKKPVCYKCGSWRGDITLLCPECSEVQSL